LMRRSSRIADPRSGIGHAAANSMGNLLAV
jgi:hypothetical protein